MVKDKKRILFLTGTRADFGKLKPLMGAVASSDSLEIFVFVTGMHMLKKFGYTCAEVERMNYDNTFLLLIKVVQIKWIEFLQTPSWVCRTMLPR